MQLWTRAFHPIESCLRCCLLLAALSGRAAEREVLFETGFEEGLRGWRTQGEAEFIVDDGLAHGGKQCARISIGPAGKPWYQQLQYHIKGLNEGDLLRAVAWVRTEGVQTSPGAYFVLEFVDARGRRVGIAHSKTGAGDGKRRWEQLVIRAAVSPSTDRVRIALILHAHGTAWFDDVEVTCLERMEPWPDLGVAPREVTVHTSNVVHPRFGGVGFHVFHHTHDMSKDHLEQVVAKRWRELNPSFARLNDKWDWDRAALDKVAAHVLRLKETATEIYFATWGPKDTEPGQERAEYARRVVDNLEYLVREKGCTNIKYYCMSNEMSLNGWGKLRSDLPKFRDYHNELFREIRRRKLNISLLATDAAPLASWHTIEWAAKNMDDITGVYGGHHYINRRHPKDERFYPWFLSEMERGVRVARRRGKDFILGEFGCKQDGRTLNGVKMDRCIYWDTPTEPLVGIQLAEATIAAMNAGIYAMGNWTFMDFPDGYRKTYINKWGTFRWSGSDYSTRAHYYAFGLLTKFLRGPATVFGVGSSDPRVRAAAVEHHGTKTYSVAVVNRNKVPIELRLRLPLKARLRKYVYDPANVPFHPFGDLQEPAGTIDLDRELTDTVGAGCLVVYTTAYDSRPPAAVRDLTVDGEGRLEWEPNEEQDLCYYRLYRSGEQIGSTIATQFRDTEATPGAAVRYQVVAVDQSGNTGPPASSRRRR